MSKATDAFRAKLLRRAAAQGADVRAAITRGYSRLRTLLGDKPLEQLIKAGALDNLLTERDLLVAFKQLQSTVKQGVESAGKLFGRGIPGAKGAGAIAFNVLSPAVVEGIRTLNDRALQTLASGIREGVRAVVERGLRDGVNPREVARDLRAMIGLAPNQVNAVANFRGMLETNDREALTRELRDRRFDATLKAALGGDGLTPAQIDKMTDAYQRRFVAFNAETNARTIALDAQRVGQHLSWSEAVDKGFVDGDALTKRWSGTLDDRERESHIAMEGETVAWDDSYSNGQLTPGEDEFNCRCVSIYETSGTIQPANGAAVQATF